MFGLTKEEKDAAIFLFILMFCGLAINNLAKISQSAKKLIFEQVNLGKININRVSLKELTDSKVVPGHLARKILAYRDEFGAFNSLDELKKVKGIGKRNFEKLDQLFCLE